MPSELMEGIEIFLEYYNKQRYHEALCNVIPTDASYGWREDIMAWFLASEGDVLKVLIIALISSSDSVETTFRVTFGGFRSLAGLFCVSPSTTNQLKKARRVLT